MGHLERIIERKIIAIIRGIGKKEILPTVAALIAGGIELAEVALTQGDGDKYQEDLEAIAQVCEAFKGRILVGAGTVLSVAQVNQAVAAGAEFIISPNVDGSVIQRTKALTKLSMPGALTPSEIVAAYAYGADIVKVFPAGTLGSDYIKDIKAPLRHIPLLAVGGVNSRNIADFFRAGAVGVGIGGSLVSKQAVTAGNFDHITRVAASLTAQL